LTGAATLSREEARRVYTRIGALQDTQAYYEDRATKVLVSHFDLAHARSVFEFGCGTGRFAARLLEAELPASATYRGVDITPAMVDLARTRLSRFGARATIELTNGGPPSGEPGASCDRFVSNFVLDLLSVEDIKAVIDEAHRMLSAGGLLGLSSLTPGFTAGTRLMAGLLAGVHRLRPQWIGGCRALELLEFLPKSQWQVRHVARVAALGVPLQAVVAQRV
jgi:ubiquinone/menaquinone biosynthesis C-methylase UbiE